MIAMIIMDLVAAERINGPTLAAMEGLSRTGGHISEDCGRFVGWIPPRPFEARGLR